MTELNWLSGFAGVHLGHSVVLSAVLCFSLIFARKMTGAGRYALCAFAMVAVLMLPIVALTPGGSVAGRILAAVDAPISIDASAVAGETAVGTVAPGDQVAAETGAFVIDRPDVVFLERGASAPVSSQAPVAVIEGAASRDLGTSAAVDLAVAAEQGSVVAAPGLVSQVWGALVGWFQQIPDLSLFFLSAWLVGTIVLLAKTAVDLVSSMRMVRASREIALPPALARRFLNVRVAVSEQAPGPIAAGIFKPSILLPVGFETELDRPGMTALLEHERAHVERRDMLVALCQRVALALFWWSPALHWISRRMDEERELACDEYAVERTGDARGFALTLTHQAESQFWGRAPRLAVGAIGGKSQLGRRIRRLVFLAKNSAGSSEGGGSSSGRMAFTGLAGVALAAAVMTPGLRANANEEPRAEALLVDEVELAQLAPEQAPPTPLAPPAPVAPVVEPDREPLPPIRPAPPAPPADIEYIDEFAFDAADFGIEIAGAVTVEVLEELPDLLEGVFESLEETGVADQEFSAEWRRELAEMRRELRDELGPEIRVHVARELDRARAERDRALHEAQREIQRARAEMERELTLATAEIERARVEVDRALARSDARSLSADQKAEIRESVRAALDEAREQIRVARENGELDFDFDFQFDFDELESELRAEERLLEGAPDDGARGPNPGNFYLEFDLQDFHELSGPQALEFGVEDHAQSIPWGRTGGLSGPRIGQNDCPQQG